MEFALLFESNRGGLLRTINCGDELHSNPLHSSPLGPAPSRSEGDFEWAVVRDLFLSDDYRAVARNTTPAMMECRLGTSAFHSPFAPAPAASTALGAGSVAR